MKFNTIICNERKKAEQFLKAKGINALWLYSKPLDGTFMHVYEVSLKTY